MASALPDKELEQSEVMSEFAIFAAHMKVSTDGGGCSGEMRRSSELL